MVSRATWDDLNRFAGAGRLHAVQLQLAASELRPCAGSNVLIQWEARGADAPVWLHTDGEVKRPVARVGREFVGVRGEPVAVMVECAGCHERSVIEPRVIVPLVARLMVAPTVIVGEPCRVQWHVRDAVSTQLMIRTVGGERCHDVPAVGEMVLPFDNVGRAEITLIASSADAIYSASAVCSQSRTVQVKAPPVVIHTTQDGPLHGPPGDTVILAWSVTGATGLRLVRPAWGEVLRAPLTGRAEIEVGATEEVVRLVVTGLDDKEYTKDVLVAPVFADLPNVAGQLVHMTLRHRLP